MLFETGRAVFIMKSNMIFEESQLKRVFQSYFGAYSMQIIDRTSFTEIGGELGGEQRPTFERIDMKLGPFNWQRNR